MLIFFVGPLEVEACVFMAEIPFCEASGVRSGWSLPGKCFLSCMEF